MVVGVCPSVGQVVPRTEQSFQQQIHVVEHRTQYIEQQHHRIRGYVEVLGVHAQILCPRAPVIAFLDFLRRPEWVSPQRMAPVPTAGHYTD